MSKLTKETKRGHEPAKVALHPRNVKFDWSKLPLVWIPGEVFASHYVNVLHLLLPEGERWFVKVFSEILPLIEDDQLREDVIGFIGQEGVHAAAHQEVQDYFTDNGLDVRPFAAGAPTGLLGSAAVPIRVVDPDGNVANLEERAQD